MMKTTKILRDCLEVSKVVIQSCQGSHGKILRAVPLLFLILGIQAGSPLLAKEVFDSGLAKRDLYLLLYLGAAWFALVLLGSILQYFYSLLLIKTAIESARTLKTMVLRSIMLVLSAGTETPEVHGERISRITTDPAVFADRCGVTSWMGAFTSALTLLVVGILAVYLDWQMALICFVSGGLSLVLQHGTPQKLIRSNQEVAATRAHVTGSIENILSAWRTIVRYDKIDDEVTYAKKVLGTLADADLRAERLRRLAVLLNDLIVGPMPIVLLWVGAYRVFSGNMTLGTLVAFLSYLRAISGSSMGIFRSVLQISSGVGQADYFLSLFSQQSSATGTAIDPKNDCRLSIEFENTVVHAGPFVVHIDELTLEPAQTYLLVGDSGAGKTVFLEFLAGIRRAAQGRIRLNGKACSAEVFSGRAKRFGYVKGNDTLFHRSVWDNVSYGSTALKQPHIEYEMDVLRMRDKTASPAAKLSSGEAQRVQVVRELARRPTIYIIDEGIDAMETDLQTDSLELIRSVIPDATLVICTHNWRGSIPYDSMICVSNGHVYQKPAPGFSTSR